VPYPAVAAPSYVVPLLSSAADELPSNVLQTVRTRASLAARATDGWREETRMHARQKGKETRIHARQKGKETRKRVRKKARKHESTHEPRNGRKKASPKKETEARKPRMNLGK